MKWKSVISLLLALTVLLSLCGCGAAREEEAGPPAGAQAQPTPEPTPDPRTLPQYHSTEKIQERGVLQVAVSRRSGDLWGTGRHPGRIYSGALPPDRPGAGGGTGICGM